MGNMCTTITHEREKTTKAMQISFEEMKEIEQKHTHPAGRAAAAQAELNAAHIDIVRMADTDPGYRAAEERLYRAIEAHHAICTDPKVTAMLEWTAFRMLYRRDLEHELAEAQAAAAALPDDGTWTTPRPHIAIITKVWGCEEKLRRADEMASYAFRKMKALEDNRK
jgi:hypothetical protein